MANFLKRTQYYRLLDTTLLKQIAECTQGRVLELAGGRGQLTKYLKNPVVSEINKTFYSELKKYSQQIVGDFTKLEPLFFNKFETIVGNIPYCLTKTVFKIIQQSSASTISLVLQKEVGQKIVSSTFNKVKLFINNYFNIIRYKVVSASSFKPKPAVDGFWILLSRKEVQTFKNLKKLSKLFMYPRKTLKNCYKLQNWNFNLPPEFSEKRIGQLSFELLTVIDNSL